MEYEDVDSMDGSQPDEELDGEEHDEHDEEPLTEAEQAAMPFAQSYAQDDGQQHLSPIPQGEVGGAAQMHMVNGWYPGGGYAATSGGWSGGAPSAAGVYPMPYPPNMGQPVQVSTMATYSAAQASYAGGPSMAHQIFPMGHCPTVWAGGLTPLAEATLTGPYHHYGGEDDGEEGDDGRAGGTARKNAWSREEDEILARVVLQYGASKWTKVASHLPGRMGKQCRERWFNHLAPDVKKGEWTLEEDRQIMAAVREHGTKWSVIVKQLPGRSDNAIKNRYYSAVRKAYRQERREVDLISPSPYGLVPMPTATTLSTAIAAAVPHPLTSQAVLAAQGEACLPVAQSAYASPAAPMVNPDGSLATSSLALAAQAAYAAPGYAAPLQHYAAAAFSSGAMAQYGQGQASVGLEFRHLTSYDACVPLKKQKRGRGAMGAAGEGATEGGFPLSVEQEAAALSVVAGSRLSQEEEVHMLEGLEPPMDDDMEAGTSLAMARVSKLVHS